MVKQKLVLIVFCTIFLLNTTEAASAQTGNGQVGAKKQTPFQVGATIVFCVVAMRVLNFFRIP